MFAAELQLEAAGGISDTPFVTIRQTADEKGQTVIDAFQVKEQRSACLFLIFVSYIFFLHLSIIGRSANNVWRWLQRELLLLP
jgi:hypothetical protein